MKKIMTEWRQFLNEEEQQPITVGQLRAVVEILSSGVDDTQKQSKLKNLGKLGFKIGIGLIPVVGTILRDGVEIVDNITGLFKAATSPKNINQGKLDNKPWVKMLGIDPEFSKIIDDEVEREFLDKYIERYTSKIMGLSDDTPLPNFTSALAKHINKTKLNPTPSRMRISKK